jgi:hypothetical protein
MKRQNISKTDVYQILKHLRSEYITEQDEQREDIIIELMDVVSGFCSPNNKIW